MWYAQLSILKPHLNESNHILKNSLPFLLAKNELIKVDDTLTHTDTKIIKKEDTILETDITHKTAKNKNHENNKDYEKCISIYHDLIIDEDLVIPTMNLKVIDIRPSGIHPVYDIQVDEQESFLANGVVAHNCMIAHGAMGFLKERMMDVSDKFTVYVCNECGLFSSVNPNDDAERKCGACDNYSEFTELNIPYACKLLMQELEGMMITPRFNQEKPNL